MHLNAPSSVTLADIPAGRAGIVDTLKAMRDFVRESRNDYTLRQTAVDIVRQVGGKNWTGEVAAIYDWVHNNIRYTLDPVDVEQVHAPAQILNNRAGDCDDFSVLVAALLEQLGHPVAFKAVGEVPGELTHVYVITKIRNNWIAVDATEPNGVGWEPPGIADEYTLKI